MPIADCPPETNSIYAQVIDLLRLEAEAIARAARRLRPADVESAVEILGACAGKIVLVGVGKSGIIAQKIAATMTSTGTVAVYLHPSDALHGGLGMVGAGDAVIVLSNSGETAEIITMMPYLHSRGVAVIAVVGNLQSTLAREADVALDASVDQEACPLGLAPTTSTTVALAIGDALAMTLMRARGLTLEDFAVNHPAGQLGKRLTLRVGDLMHRGAANPVIKASAPWLEIIQAISGGGLGAVSVVDDDHHLLGVITDGDLRRALQKSRGADLEALCGAMIMTAGPVTVTAETLAYEALHLMEDRPSQISVLPVIDEENKCIGLLRLHDVVRSGL
ncbi:MAG TPA: KpsF/GutQ family sugar-phosphate isomerase [Pyrinomonadaceae bacterium]|nr:KpsF/GutQ family sugar-phosphate isomerase [Pyrinomonadaceae bacterium]